MANATPKVDAIFMVDGLTSSRDRKSHLPIADSLTKFGYQQSWINYNPFSADGQYVETIDVFPSLFGFIPEASPGRSGLERILDGDYHRRCNYYFTFHTYKDSRLFYPTASSVNLHLRRSRYSSGGRTWIACTETRSSEVHALEYLTAKLEDIEISHRRYSPYLQRPMEKPKQNYELLGWCHGALLSALLFSEVAFNKNRHSKLSRPSFSRAERLKSVDLDIRNILERGNIPVIYCKDPAWNARKGSSKSEAIAYCAAMAKKIAQGIDFGNLLIVSDHNSENNCRQTLAGPTKLAFMSRDSRLLQDWKSSCIAHAGFDFNGVINQKELFSFIRRAWL
ncbi:hypothetical protein M0E84_03335 [Corynebacterium sp. CCM 9186]|uniref:hypothetical protein n=1 Tax=Corynebacterium meridianum TaxID=2765363 RepID=UPI002005D889|nr:hypothetical protein [Corynebacterium meridianum]MCK7677075.1 hypothetical protein [Corynebacterium meridianum]